MATAGSKGQPEPAHQTGGKRRGPGGDGAWQAHGGGGFGGGIRQEGPSVTALLGKVEQRFAGRIPPLNSAAFHVRAQITAHAELAGQPLPVMDAFLMAIAQCHGLTIVTRNVQDFTPYPQVFNPWTL